MKLKLVSTTKMCSKCEHAKKWIEKSSFQNILKNTCKNGFKNPYKSRGLERGRRNGGSPIKGIDTLLIDSKCKLEVYKVEMVVARLRALTHGLIFNKGFPLCVEMVVARLRALTHI